MLKIGIVLSGALAKGAYQVGFLKALLETIERDQIVALSGASMGACNLYGVSSNHMDKVESIWKHFDYKNLYSIWKGILFQNHIDLTFNHLFSDTDYLDIPLYVSSVSTFPKLEFHYVKLEGPYQPDFRKFMKGAVGFPFLTGPQTFYKKRLHTDGGIIDNIPIYPLTTLDIDLIIVLHFDPKFKLEQRLTYSGKNILELDLSTANGYAKKSFDFRQVTLKTRMDSGYTYGGEVMNQIVNTDKDDLNSTIQKIMDKEKALRLNHKALDTIPSKFNRILRRFRYKPNVMTTLERQYEKAPHEHEAMCANCELKMTPKKHFNFVFFLLTWWFGLGLLYIPFYFLFSKKVCPYCKKMDYHY